MFPHFPHSLIRQGLCKNSSYDRHEISRGLKEVKPDGAHGAPSTLNGLKLLMCGFAYGRSARLHGEDAFNDYSSLGVINAMFANDGLTLTNSRLNARPLSAVVDCRYDIVERMCDSLNQ